MSARLIPWAVRGWWAALPFLAGPALSAGLHHHPAFRTGASVALWAGWAAVLMATLVTHPISLTVLRVSAPAAVVIAAAAVAEGHASTIADVGALGSALGVTLLAFLPAIALAFVNGPAYPNERRYPLATPGALLFGPLELAWLLAVGLPATAALLLASHHWVAGGITAVVAAPVGFLLGRAMHGLSRRWVVFVPAGLVLHDPVSLLDPVLFQRTVIERLGPATSDSDSLDLTQGAAGLALELVLTEKVPMVRVQPGRRGGVPGASARLLFTPSRPGAVLAAAAQRKLPVALPAS